MCSFMIAPLNIEAIEIYKNKTKNNNTVNRLMERVICNYGIAVTSFLLLSKLLFTEYYDMHY